jgi:hypothetical protein
MINSTAQHQIVSGSRPVNFKGSASRYSTPSQAKKHGYLQGVFLPRQSGAAYEDQLRSQREIHGREPCGHSGIRVPANCALKKINQIKMQELMWI